MINLNIDRIVLNGFNISQSRAENIKILLQEELQTRLSQKDSIHEMHNKEISIFNTSIEQINDSASDTSIVNNITNNVMSSINSTSNKRI